MYVNATFSTVTCIYISTHSYTHTFSACYLLQSCLISSPYIYINTHIYTYSYTHIHIYTSTYTLIHTYINIHIYIFIYTYSYSYIYTSKYRVYITSSAMACHTLPDDQPYPSSSSMKWVAGCDRYQFEAAHER